MLPKGIQELLLDIFFLFFSSSFCFFSSLHVFLIHILSFSSIFQVSFISFHFSSLMFTLLIFFLDSPGHHLVIHLSLTLSLTPISLSCLTATLTSTPQSPAFFFPRPRPNVRPARPRQTFLYPHPRLYSTSSPPS